MAGSVAKIPAEMWIKTAIKVMIEEGIASVKIDRLANRLGVTRGGFYHNFEDRDELFVKILDYWEEFCHFLPSKDPGSTAQQAVLWVDALVIRVIEEDGYDPAFDMAVREWARSDRRAAWAIERADRVRLAALQQCFLTLGYDASEALIRANVFYFHQIGYYQIGVKQSIAERKKMAQLYVDILCGREVMASARAGADCL